MKNKTKAFYFLVVFMLFAYQAQAAKIGPNSILDIANNDEDIYISENVTNVGLGHMGGMAIGDINGDGIKDFAASSLTGNVTRVENSPLPVSKDAWTENNTLFLWSKTTANNTNPVADNINRVSGASSISTTRTAFGSSNLKISSSSGASLNSVSDILHFQIFAQNANERIAYVSIFAPDYNNRFQYYANIPLTAGAWNQVNIPLSNFSVGSGFPEWSNVCSVVINFWGGSSGDIKIDQFYFDHTGPVTKTAGLVYLFFGPLTGTRMLSQANVRIYGIDLLDLTGEYLDIKDINNDGFGDIIIGVPYDDGPDNSRIDCGAVYIVLGRASFPSSIDLKTDADYIIYGIDPGDLFGETVLAADINGDNIGDLIIGAQNADGFGNIGYSNGEVHIIYGPFTSGGVLDLSYSNANISFYGAIIYDFLGFQGTFGTGDVYSDGQKDLILGVYGGDKSWQSLNIGKVLIFNNISNYIGNIDLTTVLPTTTIYGADTGDFLSKIAIADINNDGIDDIIAGAPLADGFNNSKLDTGEVYAIFGSAALASNIDLNLVSPDVRIIGKNAGDNLGLKVYSGDVSNDGVDDLLMIAGGGDGALDLRNNSGTGYAVYGNSRRTGMIDLSATAPELTVYGADSNDTLRDVYSGDISGDGIADFFLGFRWASGPGNAYPYAGEVIGIIGGGISGFWLNVPVIVRSDLTYSYASSPLQSDIKIDNFSVTPLDGSLDITIDTWDNSGTSHKRWTENNVNGITADYRVADLKPNTPYNVKIDGQIWNYFVSDDLGQINFFYTHSNSGNVFEIEELVY